MSGEDPAASRVRRMLPSVSEVLKELTARAPIEPDVAFRISREVCAEELKRIRDAGGDSVPLEELVQRALKRATGGVPAPPPVVEPVPVPEPEPAPPEAREAGAAEDPFAETTGAMDLRWDRDAREPFSEPQPLVPPVPGELPTGAVTAVEAPVLPPLSFDAAPVPEPQPVFLDVPEAPEGIGDETLNRLSREAESIDLQSVFTKESVPASAPVDAAGGEAAEPEVPEPFEDDEDTVLTVPRGSRSGRDGKDGGPRVGVILVVVGVLAALGGLGYLLTGLWMERDDTPPPVAVARPRPEVRPVPEAVAAPSVESTPAAAPATVPEPAVSPAAALEAPRPAVSPAVPTPVPSSEAVAPAPVPVTFPVRQSRDGYMVTRDRAGEPEVYSIHFTSYRDRATAERDLKRVSALVGREGYVAGIDLGAKGIWQRVMIGAFPTAEEAKAVREELAAKGTRDMGWVYRVVGPD